MEVEQITICLDTKSATLADLTRVLAENCLNIRAVSLAENNGQGTLRLIVNDTERAEHLLAGLGHTVTRTPVLAVEVPDRPGGLATTLQAVKDTDLELEYMYAFSRKSGESGLIILCFNDPDRAVAAFAKADLRVLSCEEVFAS